jgi:hypothetical protein
VVALAVVAGVVVENSRSGSSDTEWVAVALVSAVLGLLCLSPAAFAATPRSYRIAAAVLAVLLSIGALHGLVVQNAYAVPAAVIAWLTTAPVRHARIG